MARPTKLTPELVTKITTLIKGGAYPSKAAVAAGLSEAGFYAWMARGRAEVARMESAGTVKPRSSEKVFVEFLEAVEQASAEIQAIMANKIVTAARDGDWKAALTYLERTNREEWGRVTRTELSGPDGGPVQSQVVAVSDAELKALADAIAGVGTVPTATQEALEDKRDE